MPGKDKLFNGDITQPGAAMAPQAFWIQPPSYTLSKADIGQIYLDRFWTGRILDFVQLLSFQGAAG